MNKSDLRKTLKAIGRSPQIFYRDTPLLLQTLDGLEENNKAVKAICNELEKRADK